MSKPSPNTNQVLGRGVPRVDPATPTWVVDPIDGTQNFVHALPLSCVSIGLCVGGAPTLGVVYDPYRDELFVGVAADAEGSEGGAGGAGGAGGEGVGGAWAYLNGERIRADGACLRLDKAVVCTDLGYERSAAGVERISNAQAALLRANV